MNLSVLKWPIIIVLVVGVGWLASAGGTNYMYKQLTDDEPGQDAEVDASNEAWLSRYGGFLLQTLRYKQAKKFFDAAVQRYPEGENVWYNYYRLARAEQKLHNYEKTVEILNMLIDNNAQEKDERVPNNDILTARMQKLAETHGIEEYIQ